MKLISKGHILHNSIYIAFSKWKKNCQDGEQVNDWQGLWMVGWDVCDYKQHKGDLGGDGISLYLDCDGGYTDLYMG